MHRLTIAVITISLLLLCGIGYSFHKIYLSVKSAAGAARAEYGTDTVEALIRTVDSDTRSFRERNRAVWALGQIADKRALPVLNKYITGEIPDREPINAGLSQYELRKAVKWCTKGNWTSWMYENLKNNRDDNGS